MGPAVALGFVILAILIIWAIAGARKKDVNRPPGDMNPPAHKEKRLEGPT